MYSNKHHKKCIIPILKAQGYLEKDLEREKYNNQYDLGAFTVPKIVYIY